MKMRRQAGESWIELGLVFCTRQGVGTRRSQRPAFVPPGRERRWAQPTEWTPRELRHSFVSLLSSSGVTIEEIAHLVGHGRTSVTERVYRKELRPVITRGRAPSTSSSMATPSDRPTVWPTGQAIQAKRRVQGSENGRLTRAGGRYWI